MGLNLKALIAKLNDQSRAALEGAAGLCLSRTHYDIEVEHFLTKLLDSSSNDFAAIIKHFEIDKSRLTAELARSMDKLKSGNARTPAISPTVLKMLTRLGRSGPSISMRARCGPGSRCWLLQLTKSSRGWCARSAKNSRRSTRMRCARI